MTLDEAVRNNAGGKLFIGAAAGYVFIGTAEEYDIYIDSLCSSYYDKLLGILAKNEKDYNLALEKLHFRGLHEPEDYRNIAVSRLKEINAWTDFDIKKSPAIRSLVHALETVRINSVAVPKMRKQIQNWTPWRERPVKRVEQIERGTQIIFEGVETGDYWLEEECRYDLAKVDFSQRYIV